jgi:hypothetical protein
MGCLGRKLGPEGDGRPGNFDVCTEVFVLFWRAVGIKKRTGGGRLSLRYESESLLRLERFLSEDKKACSVCNGKLNWSLHLSLVLVPLFRSRAAQDRAAWPSMTWRLHVRFWEFKFWPFASGDVGCVVTRSRLVA